MSHQDLLRIQSCALLKINSTQKNPGVRPGSYKGPEANNVFEANTLPLSWQAPAKAHFAQT